MVFEEQFRFNCVIKTIDNRTHHQRVLSSKVSGAEEMTKKKIKSIN